jgi:hypothetical protein
VLKNTPESRLDGLGDDTSSRVYSGVSGSLFSLDSDPLRAGEYGAWACSQRDALVLWGRGADEDDCDLVTARVCGWAPRTAARGTGASGGPGVKIPIVPAQYIAPP